MDINITSANTSGMSVNLYELTSIRSPRQKRGYGIYILEFDTSKGPATLTNTMLLEDMTRDRADLYVISEALKRLTIRVNITIFTDSTYIQGAIEEHRINKWMAAGWRNSKGQPVKHKDLWQQVGICFNRLSVNTDHHEYKTWMTEQLKNLERKEKDEKDIHLQSIP